jgi:aminoglycoside phosphotransferase (APT) family kinase protein
MSHSPALLPPPVAALLAVTFPGQPIGAPTPTTGGFSNLSAHVRVGGRPCVVKAATAPAKRADLRREALVLALLRGRRLGAPAPVALAEDGDWSILVTRHRRGTPGQRLFDWPAPALEPPLHALGRSLARLHRLRLPPPDGAAQAGLLLAERAAALAAALATLPLPGALHDPLRAARAHQGQYAAPPRLVHGDPGLHNVLWAAPGLTLLDWEFAGWGDPRTDLAWLAWTMRFRALPPRCWQALLVGYGPAALPIDEGALHTLALGQVASLLVRAAGGPAWDEWLRRARWTLDLDRLL